MHELLRTNDAVLVSAVVALLESAGINSLVFDQNMSVLEGSLGVLSRRVLVAEGQELRGRQLLKDAGLGHELRPDENLDRNERRRHSWRQAPVAAAIARPPFRP